MMPTWGYQISEIVGIIEVLIFPLLFKVCHYKNGFFVSQQPPILSCMYARPSVKPKNTPSALSQ